MKIDLVQPRFAEERLFAQWEDVRSSDPAFASPFFASEFTRAVASVRDDVEAAVLHEGRDPVGFFPFHRDRSRCGERT